MIFILLPVLYSLAFAKDRRTFAILRHSAGGPLGEARIDPIVSPGVPSEHVHTIMGASNFGLNATGDSLLRSSCTTALIKDDLSAYWFPKLYFKDPKTDLFESVNLSYMNVNYFFEPTDDKITAFPVGLQIVSGDASIRHAPSKTGKINLNPLDGIVQPSQWTCPRIHYSPPSYPANSNGSTAGIQNPDVREAGIGFPFANCDLFASPLRMDIHFPSCYNPAVPLTDYKNNMAFPVTYQNGKQNCLKNWIHVPHLLYEVYWDTTKFSHRWKPHQGYQPFILSNGDKTGYSIHGDFLAGWDEQALQHIIDTFNVTSSKHFGMETCPGVAVNKDNHRCVVNSLIDEHVTGTLVKLPGHNLPTGWD
ncbi:hypothetical protein RB601_003660, partial [Gaeumannomyces tritici]